MGFAEGCLLARDARSLVNESHRPVILVIGSAIELHGSRRRSPIRHIFRPDRTEEPAGGVSHQHCPLRGRAGLGKARCIDWWQATRP
jgi:hypothetical protein